MATETVRTLIASGIFRIQSIVGDKIVLRYDFREKYEELRTRNPLLLERISNYGSAAESAGLLVSRNRVCLNIQIDRKMAAHNGLYLPDGKLFTQAVERAVNVDFFSNYQFHELFLGAIREAICKRSGANEADRSPQAASSLSLPTEFATAAETMVEMGLSVASSENLNTESSRAAIFRSAEMFFNAVQEAVEYEKKKGETRSRGSQSVGLRR